jgi:hypothetical protein
MEELLVRVMRKRGNINTKTYTNTTQTLALTLALTLTITGTLSQAISEDDVQRAIKKVAVMLFPHVVS